MPDQAQVSLAGWLLRGQAGGCFRCSLSRKLRATAPSPGCPPSCRRGRRCPGDLFVDTDVVATSRAAAPRGDCAVEGGERANGGWVSRTVARGNLSVADSCQNGDR